ncbi:MAG TPA: terminase small subunit [Stellaceae bacterium]
MASGSGRRPTSRSASGSRRGKPASEPAARASPESFPNEIAARAARLGVTPERVLREYARIAFADLRRVADWGPDGLVLKTPGMLSDADAAAISEITPAAGGSGSYRVKLYDKKAALDAIARHLGMFVQPPRPPEDGAPADLAEDAREVLARRLARLAAGGAEK